MKKIIYVILGVLLFLPTIVKADMGAPMIKEYKASVKNPDGADIYRFDFDNEKYVKTGDKLKYGTIIIVDYEEDGWIEINTGEESEEENEAEEKEDLYVQLKELTAVNKTYKVNSKELDTAISALIVKDQAIRKGPAYGYESTGKTIKAVTTVKVRGLLEYNEEDKKYYDEGNPWMYVEYNGTKGFIEAYEGKVAFNKVTTTVMANNDAEVINPQTGKKVGIIKANTKTNLTLYTLDAWYSDYYVEYDNVKGYVEDEVVFPKQETLDFKITEKIKVYETLKYNDDGDLISKLVTTLPKSTAFSSNYYLIFNGWVVIYYEKGNVKGWISENEGTYNSEEEGEEYRDIADVLGFEYPEDENILEDKEEETGDNENVETEQPTEVVPEDVVSDVKNDDKPSSNSNQILYLCIGAAIVISLTAVVTILLVNKKKKNKKEVKVEEKDEEK